MENEKVIDGGLLRFKAILASESFGTPDDSEFQIDDADLVHADVEEAPITAPVTAPDDGLIELSDESCKYFEVPLGTKMTWAEFGFASGEAGMRELKKLGWPNYNPPKRKRRRAA
jgi:hypothetical protein